MQHTDTPAPAPAVAPAMNRQQRRDAAKAAKRKRPQITANDLQQIFAKLLAPMDLLANCQPYRDEEVQTDFIKCRLFFENLKAGTATAEEFNKLATTINLATIRAQDIDAGLTTAMQAAQAALRRCLARYCGPAKAFGFDGTGLQAMPTALDISEAIVSNSSPQQMMTALNTLKKIYRLPEFAGLVVDLIQVDNSGKAVEGKA